MVCPQCGRRTFKGEAFCPKCGAPMPTERKNTEGESNLNQRFRKFSYTDNNSENTESQPVTAEHPPYVPAPAETPTYNPTEQPKPPSEEVPPSVFIPEIEFKPVSKPVANPSDDGELHSEKISKPEFYGSYGAICNDDAKQNLQPEPDLMEFTPVFSTSAPTETSPVNSEWSLPKNSETTLIENKTSEKIEFDEDAPFNPIPSDLEEDELILPDLNDRFAQHDNDGDVKKKSMGYEDTVKLENAGKAYKNETPINQPIQKYTGRERVASKVVEITAIASGTAKAKSDLPQLKENQMYAIITPKQLKQLRRNKFRGLGIICTLCLVIIASFCIWSYVNSFADPLIGRWKGDIKSSDIQIEAISQLDQDILNSTWEFSDSGSMYLSIIVNETPISLSGTYTEQHDENGEQYLSMTLNNPMDSSEYTLNMYYTVTGKILEFNDMQGLGITIDLIKE